MKYKNILSVCLLVVCVSLFGQENNTVVNVFNKQPINFNGEKGSDTKTQVLQNGRVVYKKITVPDFPNGTDVNIKLTVRSNGDRWDKSGSCFVVANPKLISILDVSKGEKKFPKDSFKAENHAGIVAGETY